MRARKVTKQKALNAIYKRVEAKNNLETVNSQINIEISQVKEKHTGKVGFYEQEVASSDAIVAQYVSENRADLFQDGVKSTDFGSATVGFRLKPATVGFGDGWDLKKVIRKLKNRFPDLVKVKTTESLDKRKVIEFAAGGKLDSCGIVIEQQEIFFIK